MSFISSEKVVKFRSVNKAAVCFVREMCYEFSRLVALLMHELAGDLQWKLR